MSWVLFHRQDPRLLRSLRRIAPAVVLSWILQTSVVQEVRRPKADALKVLVPRQLGLKAEMASETAEVKS